MEVLPLVFLCFIVIAAAEEKQYDCVDSRRILRCVFPENCPQDLRQPHRTCPIGRLCCRTGRTNLYTSIHRVANRSPKTNRAPPVPNTGSLDFRSLTESSDRIVFPDERMYTAYETVPNSNDNSIDSDKTVHEKSYQSKSAKYCEKVAKLSVDYLHAMPLLPEVMPMVIEMENCEPSFTPLIVGGKNATIGEFPHMTALGFNRSNGIDYLCGGTLISEQFVMTAAHCTATRWGPPVEAFLGAVELYSSNGLRVRITKTIPHPDYTPLSCYNDIALVKLAHDIKLNSKLRPACLPNPMSGEVSGGVLATGWGKLGYGKESSNTLLKVPLKIVGNRDCGQFYASDTKTRLLRDGITSDLVCASGPNTHPTYDTCQGDSGGPLISYLPQYKCVMQVVGVTSFGKSCGSSVPGVYTRVSSYVPWIESVVWP